MAYATRRDAQTAMERIRRLLQHNYKYPHLEPELDKLSPAAIRDLERLANDLDASIALTRSIGRRL